MTDEQFKAILASKLDKSRERYDAGWIELRDRYDITVALVHGPSVLDIGCAQSVLASLLRVQRPDVVRVAGLDAEPQMIAQSRATLGDDAELYNCFAEQLPFDALEFDTVVIGQTLEHVKDLLPVCHEATRVLKRGGRLIVNVPSDERDPHGNHLRVFHSIAELLIPFGTCMHWQGEARVHGYWFAWGEKIA